MLICMCNLRNAWRGGSGLQRDCCKCTVSLFFLLHALTTFNNLLFGDNSINKELWIIQSGKKYFNCFSWSPVLSSLTTEQTKYCQDLPPQSCKQAGLEIMRCTSGCRVMGPTPLPRVLQQLLSSEYVFIAGIVQVSACKASSHNSTSIRGRNPFLVSFGKTGVIF